MEVQLEDWISESPDNGSLKAVSNPTETRESEEVRDACTDDVAQQQDEDVDEVIRMQGIENSADAELPPTINKKHPSSRVLLPKPHIAEMAGFYPAFAAAVEQRYTNFNPDVYALPGSAKKASVGERPHPNFAGAVKERYGNLDPAVYNILTQAKKAGAATKSYPVFTAAAEERYCEFDPDASVNLDQATKAIRDEGYDLTCDMIPTEIFEGDLEPENTQNSKESESSEESEFASAVEDLRKSSMSRTADAYYPHLQRLVDSNGKFHGYDGFPPEDIIENPYTATSSFPLQNYSAADLDLTKYTFNQSPYINDLYYTEALEETLELLDRSILPNLDEARDRPASARAPLTRSTSVEGEMENQYLIPSTRKNGYNTTEDSIVQDGQEAQSDISAFFDALFPLGQIQDLSSGVFQNVVDGGIYGAPPDLIYGVNHTGLLLNDDELIKAGTDYVRQFLGDSKNPGEVSNALVPQEIVEWLKSNYNDRRLVGKAFENTTSDDTQFQDGKYLKTVTPPKDDHSPLTFGRCVSPPLRLAPKYGKSKRTIEISDAEFNKLLSFYDGIEQQQIWEVLSDTSSEDIIMQDFDISVSDTVEHVEAQSQVLSVLATQPIQAQGKREANGLGRKPGSELSISSAPSKNACKTSGTNGNIRNHTVSVQGRPRNSSPMQSSRSTFVSNGNPRAMRLLQLALSPQRPTLDSRYSAASSAKSSFIVYSPGVKFSPVKVSPRKFRSIRESSTIPASVSDLKQAQPVNLSISQHPRAVRDNLLAVSDLGQAHACNTSVPTFTSLDPLLADAPPVPNTPLAAIAPAISTCFDNSQLLSSIPVFFGSTRGDIPSTENGVENVTSTSTYQGQQIRLPQRESFREENESNFITPIRRGRGPRRGRGGREVGGVQTAKGRGDYGAVGGHHGRGGESSGYNAPHVQDGHNGRGGYRGGAGQSGHGRGGWNSMHHYGAPLFPALTTHNYQHQGSTQISQPWNHRVPTSPPPQYSLHTPNRSAMSPCSTVNTPSAFFSPMSSYVPPTPTPLSRPGHNYDPYATYSSPMSHLRSLPPLLDSSLPANHYSRRRSHSFLHPPSEEQCSEAAIPFYKPQAPITSTNQPRETATVEFVDSPIRDLCMNMFEREKTRSDKGRQMVVVESMEGSRVLIVSGPMGSNVRGYLQGIFGPNVNISMSLR